MKEEIGVGLHKLVNYYYFFLTEEETSETSFFFSHDIYKKQKRSKTNFSYEKHTRHQLKAREKYLKGIGSRCEEEPLFI